MPDVLRPIIAALVLSLVPLTLGLYLDSVVITGLGVLIPVGLIALLVYWAREG